MTKSEELFFFAKAGARSCFFSMNRSRSGTCCLRVAIFFAVLLCGVSIIMFSGQQIEISRTLAEKPKWTRPSALSHRFHTGHQKVPSVRPAKSSTFIVTTAKPFQNTGVLIIRHPANSKEELDRKAREEVERAAKAEAERERAAKQAKLDAEHAAIEESRRRSEIIELSKKHFEAKRRKRMAIISKVFWWADDQESMREARSLLFASWNFSRYNIDKNNPGPAADLILVVPKDEVQEIPISEGRPDHSCIKMQMKNVTDLRRIYLDALRKIVKLRHLDCTVVAKTESSCDAEPRSSMCFVQEVMSVNAPWRKGLWIDYFGVALAPFAVNVTAEGEEFRISEFVASQYGTVLRTDTNAVLVPGFQARLLQTLAENTDPYMSTGTILFGHPERSRFVSFLETYITSNESLNNTFLTSWFGDADAVVKFGNLFYNRTLQYGNVIHEKSPHVRDVTSIPGTNVMKQLIESGTIAFKNAPGQVLDGPCDNHSVTVGESAHASCFGSGSKMSREEAAETFSLRNFRVRNVTISSVKNALGKEAYSADLDLAAYVLSVAYHTANFGDAPPYFHAEYVPPVVNCTATASQLSHPIINDFLRNAKKAHGVGNTLEISLELEPPTLEQLDAELQPIVLSSLVTAPGKKFIASDAEREIVERGHRAVKRIKRFMKKRLDTAAVILYVPDDPPKFRYEAQTMIYPSWHYVTQTDSLHAGSRRKTERDRVDLVLFAHPLAAMFLSRHLPLCRVVSSDDSIADLAQWSLPNRTLRPVYHAPVANLSGFALMQFVEEIALDDPFERGVCLIIAHSFQHVFNEQKNQMKYGYMDSLAFVVNPSYRQFFLHYGKLLRTDGDVFLTPKIFTFRPSKPFVTGGGAYAVIHYTRLRLAEIAASLGLRHQGLHGIGSTWFTDPWYLLRVMPVVLATADHFLTNEFDGPTVLRWFHWWRGVTSMYAAELGVNHVVDACDIQFDRANSIVDGHTTNPGPIGENVHIHCWHGDGPFAKLHFYAGKYKRKDYPVASLNISLARDYSFYIALHYSRDVAKSAPPRDIAIK